jgi:hypothetical protein
MVPEYRAVASILSRCTEEEGVFGYRKLWAVWNSSIHVRVCLCPEPEGKYTKTRAGDQKKRKTKNTAGSNPDLNRGPLAISSAESEPNLTEPKQGEIR